MRRLSDDRGATAVIAAMVVAGLMGVVGLAVDAGAIYQERRELATAADAAALAIAQDCALGTHSCDPATALATAASFADANSRDGTSNVSSVVLEPGLRRVAVTASTRNADGTGKVRPFFAQVVGWDGMTVEAAATAIWGHPRTGSGLPLTIDECEFYTAIQGTGYGPGSMTTLWYKDPKGEQEMPCPAGHPNGKDAPGAWGWLDTPDNNRCDSGGLTVGQWAEADPGFSPSKGCKSNIPPLNADYMIPVYDQVTGNGNNVQYHVAGFALFRLMGYNFPNWGQAGQGCNGSGKGCITGYFVRDTLFTGEVGGPNLGIVIVKLIG